MRPHAMLYAALDGRRRRLVASARGRVVDVGGFLDNGPHYRGDVSVHDVSADELVSLPEQGFDTVVCTLVLCTFDDLGGALADIRRVLTTEGRLLFLEHVAGGPSRRLAQRLAAPAWSRLFDGCRPDRDTVAAVRNAGFSITDLDRFSIRFAAPVVRPAVHGVAKVAA